MYQDEYRVGEAARAFGVSRDTVKRRLRAGAFPNARRFGQLANAPWLIPHQDLAAAGFELAAHGWDEQPTARRPASGAQQRELAEEVADLRDRVLHLEDELQRLRIEVLEDRNQQLTQLLEAVIERGGER